MTEFPILGGCLCGAILYQVNGPALQTSYCHCSDCRKASGAPAVAWTFFRSGTLEWRRGTPKVLHFADRERSFCGDCGSPLMFFDPSLPDLFEMNTSTLDDPDAYPPTDHCWLSDKVRWTSQLADLPCFDFASPLPNP